MPIFMGSHRVAIAVELEIGHLGVEPGQEIGLSRLEKGVDTVSVTNFAYAMTDM